MKREPVDSLLPPANPLPVSLLQLFYMFSSLVCLLTLFKVLLFNRSFGNFYVAKSVISFTADNLDALQEGPAQFQDHSDTLPHFLLPILWCLLHVSVESRHAFWSTHKTWT